MTIGLVDIVVQATTNFAGNWLAMWLYEENLKRKEATNESSKSAT